MVFSCFGLNFYLFFVRFLFFGLSIPDNNIYFLTPSTFIILNDLRVSITYHQVPGFGLVQSDSGYVDWYSVMTYVHLKQDTSYTTEDILFVGFSQNCLRPFV